MCAPTDSLLFAEDLVIFLARKQKIFWRSKISVWRFRHELKTQYSLSRGTAVVNILAVIDRDLQTTLDALISKGISFASHMKSCPANYGEIFDPLHVLVRCAWICGLAILSYKKGDTESLEKALFVIADDFHEIPEFQFKKDNLWAKLLECATEILDVGMSELTGVVRPLSLLYKFGNS